MRQTSSLALILPAVAAALWLGGCSSGDSESARAGNASSDRGALEPANGENASFTEVEDFARLRNAAFTSAIPTYVASSSPLEEDNTRHPLLGNKARLHYNAIKHTGYLVSIPLSALGANLEMPGAYSNYLASINLWGTLLECPNAPTHPRWSINNMEVAPYDRLPSTTDTNTQTYPGTPQEPANQPNTPRNRYIDNTWKITVSDPTPDPILAGYGVWEYYLREPFIPNSFGSRVISAWLNRYGRIGMIRNQHDRWGFGSISEARGFDRNALFAHEGAFLADGTNQAVNRGQFAGTFAYRVNTGRAAIRPSFWPGAPEDETGNRPITFGWAFDPETGQRVGPAIHVAGIAPLCTVSFEIRFSPKAQDGSAFQPTRDPVTGTITATSDEDYQLLPVVNPSPQIYVNNDPNRPLYPITYKAYVPSCLVAGGTSSTNSNTTYLPPGNIIIESSLQSNEAIIVPQLKAVSFPDALPNGTWRISIVVTDITRAGCPPMIPTEDAASQTRYFHVWNGAAPSFFRP